MESLPVYTGEIGPDLFSPRLQDLQLTCEQLQQDLPISREEFEAYYFENGGLEVNGYACVLLSSFVTECLNMIIATLQQQAVSKGQDISDETIYRDIDLRELSERVEGAKYTYKVLQSVLARFSSAKATLTKYTLNEQKVAVWFGIEALKTHASRPISPGDFLLKWKGFFPSFYSVPIELSWLAGYYARPLANQIQYFPRNALSRDPRKRFAELFTVQSTWELEEIAPYVEELNVKNMKLDKFIIKYARRKKVGKKTVISAR